MRIIQDKELFYIQQSNSEYLKSTGIKTDYDATLCKFNGIIYRGSEQFETIELAQEKVKEIENGLEVSFIPNKKHHALASVN